MNEPKRPVFVLVLFVFFLLLCSPFASLAHFIQPSYAEVNGTSSGAVSSSNLVIYLARHGITTDGLMFFSAMDENSGITPRDVSGYNNSGTLKPNSTAGPTWTLGKINSGLGFDGIDDSVQVPDSKSLDITEELTIEAWIYSDNYTSIPYGVILGKFVSAYELALTAGHVVFQANRGSDVRAKTSSTLSSGWHHIAFTFDKNQENVYNEHHSIFLDGVIQPLVWINGADTDQMLQVNSYPVSIGSRSDNTLFFNGTIDEVRIYNRALSNNQIRSNYIADIGIVQPSSSIVFEGWVFDKTKQEFVETATDITTIVSLGSVQKANSSTFYPGGLFKVTLSGETDAGNYSYTVYASTSNGNTVENKTVNIVVPEVYMISVVSQSKGDNSVSYTICGLYAHTKSTTWDAQLNVYNQSLIVVYSKSMAFSLRGQDNSSLFFGVAPLSDGQYTAELQITNRDTGYILSAKTITFEVTTLPSGFNLFQYWIIPLLIIMIVIISSGVLAWHREPG